MSNETATDTTAKTEHEGGSLAQRLREEGDHSDCKYQCERLHGFAEEVDTLRAQLEAAEAFYQSTVTTMDEIATELRRLIDVEEAGRLIAEARAEAAEAECARLRDESERIDWLAANFTEKRVSTRGERLWNPPIFSLARGETLRGRIDVEIARIQEAAR